MAKKTDVFNVSAGVDTIIGSGVSLKGALISDGDIAIDGKLSGNIKAGGHVSVGVNGQIVGPIQATSIQIAGHVRGALTADDSVSLIETSQVHGDITTGRLEIGMGALFIGTSKMKPIQATEILDRSDAASDEKAA